MRASYALHVAPRRRHVQHAVDDERCRFLRAADVEVAVPGEAELADVARVDLGERAEALLAVGPAGRDPLARLGVGGHEPLRIDGGGGGRRGGVGGNGCIAPAAASRERGCKEHQSGNSLHCGRHQLACYGTEILPDSMPGPHSTQSPLRAPPSSANV